MKNCFVLFSLLVGISGFSQKEIFLTGKTKSATVYLNGAQVNKSITCTVPKGKSTIVIQQITPL